MLTVIYGTVYINRYLSCSSFQAPRWRISVRFKRGLSSRHLRAVLADTDTRALLGHRYLDEQRAECALGAGAGRGGDRAGWPRKATASFEVSEMEEVNNNGDPEQREVGADHDHISGITTGSSDPPKRPVRPAPHMWSLPHCTPLLPHCGSVV